MRSDTLDPAAPLTEYEGACSGSLNADNGRAVRDVLDRVGGKWSLLIINTLRQRTLRYGELAQHIPGISQRMLTLTLRQLERDGLVTRAVFGEVPPRVEYTLTKTGETLIEPAIALASWAIENYPTIEAARERYDVGAASEAAAAAGTAAAAASATGIPTATATTSATGTATAHHRLDA